MFTGEGVDNPALNPAPLCPPTDERESVESAEPGFD